MLYLVSTPIGNLEDLSFRALRVFKECDYILAEDTRRTALLLRHYQIEKRLVSFNEFSEKKKAAAVIEDLLSGKEIALATDSGTPSVSDPGFFLVRECVIRGIKVSPIPGPSAPISGLICSGFPTDRFTFYGFFPKSGSKKKKLLAQIIEREETAIFFESPHRLKKTLILIAEMMPEVGVAICREMTKKFEEIAVGKPKDLAERNFIGEITLIIKRSG